MFYKTHQPFSLSTINLIAELANPSTTACTTGTSSGGGCGGLVDLTDSRGRTHILDGDATGGGHGPGRGISGKSEFPFTWSDDEVIHQISDVATDPNSTRGMQSNGRMKVTGTRNAIDITVILDPRNGFRIITGFPTNVPRNP